MAVKSISELDTQATANDSDLFEVAIVDGGSASGYSSKKESAAVIAEGIVNQYTYPLGMPNMQAKTILGAINQLLANVAAVYDDTATYSVGAFVTYNGQLYKCNTAVGTAETFDPTKWDAVTIAENFGSGAGGIDYSTTEQDTGLKWTDGKPIYQKTIKVANFSVSTNYTIDISSLNIDAVVSMPSGYIKLPNDMRSVPFGLTGEYALSFDTNPTTLTISRKGGSLSITLCEVTIQYTKTTD